MGRLYRLPCVCLRWNTTKSRLHHLKLPIHSELYKAHELLQVDTCQSHAGEWLLTSRRSSAASELHRDNSFTVVVNSHPSVRQNSARLIIGSFPT